MAIFSGAVVPSLIVLKCPHCGKAQSRARKPEGEHYRCTKCRKLFTAAEARPKPQKKRVKM